MRISDWSSDVCSSDLLLVAAAGIRNLDRLRNCRAGDIRDGARFAAGNVAYRDRIIYRNARLTLTSIVPGGPSALLANPNLTAKILSVRSEEHKFETQFIMRLSYALFRLKKKKTSLQQHMQNKH